MAGKVLIIDDDVKLQKLLREYLGGYGFETAAVGAVSDTEGLMRREKPDIVLLDIMLPGKDGFDILKEIRLHADTPVLMLTAKGDEPDRIVGLELGADDYIAKPFNPRELLARMKAVMRRSGPLPRREGAPRGESVRAGGLTLDPLSLTLEMGGKKVELSQTECRLLEALMRRANTAVDRDSLMNAARGRDFLAFERSIDMHVSRIRSKIARIAGNGSCIRTVRGAGYMFVADS